MPSLLATAILVLFAVLPGYAGEADVLTATVQRESGRRFSFSATLKHTDEGWDHYADRWEVLLADGTILETRTLYHPHVSEQPFTRSLSGVNIPKKIMLVKIRAHDLVHGYGGQEFELKLP